MKQKSLLIVLIFCVVNFVFNAVCLQRELQSLTSSLQNLAQKLATQTTGLAKLDERPLPPPPPPAPAVPAFKLTKTRHYFYITPQGNKLDIYFGLKNVSSNATHPVYSLAMIGPQLQAIPDEPVFIRILNSRDNDQITYYPSHSNEKMQEEYVIVDGQRYAYEQNLENNIRKHLDSLENTYAKLQEIFQNNYQGERRLESGAQQKGSIFGTSMDDDENYLTQLTDFTDQIFKHETDMYKIKNKNFYENYLIPTLNTYFKVVENFNERVNDFMDKFGTTQVSKLSPIIHKNKFNIIFDTLRDKQIKAREYDERIHMPLHALVDNIRNFKKALGIEKLNLRPKSMLEQYYDSLTSNVPVLPARKIEKERPQSIEVPAKTMTKEEAEQLERELAGRRKTMSEAGFKNLLGKVEEYRKSLQLEPEEEEEEWED